MQNDRDALLKILNFDVQFEIDWELLICQNYRKELLITYGRSDFKK